MDRKTITSFDVAKLAGVSQSTVSRTYDPASSVAPATRARVMDAARKLGYKPNVIARSLSTQHTDIISLVMANIANSLFYPRVLERFTQKLQTLDKQVLLFTMPPDHPVDEILPRVLGYRVDGLLIASTTPSDDICEECVGNGIRVVLFNRQTENGCANAVCCDNELGGRLAADALLDAGHERIGYIAGIPNTSTNIMREKGFVDQLRARGYKRLLRAEGAYTYESGCEAARQLLMRDERPDAIFCAADIMAMGAMDVARYQLGMQIPDDLSVIGHDDIPVAGYPAYSLTTISQPIDAMVDAAVDLLTQDADEMPTGILRLLPGELVVRSSARL